ncbi:MAG: pyruvate kinase [Eubacteriales bacterium]
MRKTKIVCTLGPSTENEDVLRQLMLAGMDVARINFSHSTHEEHLKKINMVKKLRAELGLHVALLLDTKGPEVRLGTFADGPVSLCKGDEFILTAEDVQGDAHRVSVSYKNLYADLSKGTRLLIDDGLIELVVESIRGKDIHCTVLNGGPVSSRKSVNVPGVKLSMPTLSEKDKDDIAFGAAQDFDFLAASFTQTAQDILAIRLELEKHGCDSMRIIAKIENALGVENIDEIIKVSDGIMVARGDMGVELALEEIPVIQKKLITKGYMAGKQVITATQMLESMIKNPRPTRAETTDVANAIYDGTSAIMLSGETAVGLYPIEVVKTMSRIAMRAENDIDYIKRLEEYHSASKTDVTSAISHATCTTAHDLGASAIIAITKSGKTARMISRFRPETPIIAGSPDEKTCRQLSMAWGVTPVLMDEMIDPEEIFHAAVDIIYRRGILKYGELVVITAGLPLGLTGTTNMLKVQIVGDILVTGRPMLSKTVVGTLCVCDSEEQLSERFSDGNIIVIPATSNNILPYIKRSAGLIVEAEGVNSHAAIVGLALGLPVLVGAANATKILKNGTTATLDGTDGTVYCGDMMGKHSSDGCGCVVK